MRFSFYQKLAFCCNLFFALSVFIHRALPGYNNNITGTVFIIGYFLGLLLNPLAGLWAAVLLLRRRTSALHPVWVPIINFVFLILQLLYIFYLND